MTNSPTRPHVDPATLLPADWNNGSDVLLIVGEGAGSIAAPFVEFGLKRVIAMFPDTVPTEVVPTDALRADSRSELSKIVNLLPAPHPQRYATIRTPHCSLSTETTQGIQQLLENLVKRKRSNQTNVERLAPLWAINGVKNLIAVAKNPMISDIGHAFHRVPLIIVGAGPSLSKNIHLLREAQDKAIILCVNRALRSLQNEGIWPDLTINLEPQDVAAQFTGIDLQKIPGLILAASSHPALYSLPAPHILSYCPNTNTEGWMFEPSVPAHEISSGGSVSCSAFSLAIQWGCDPIILVGQDLSFPGGSYYHSGGADGDAKAVYDESTKQWQLQDYSADLAHTLADKIKEDGLRFSGTHVPGYHGGEVPTSTDFAAFRAWFENTALDFNGRFNLYNCTEGGAFIGGMMHTPLANVLDTLPVREVDVHAILQNISAPIQQRVDWAMQRMETLAHDLDRAIQLSAQCMRYAQQAEKKAKVLQKFDRYQSEIRPILRRLPPLNLITQQGIRKAISAGRQAQTMQQSMRANHALYTVIHDGCVRLKSALPQNGHVI